MKIIALLIALVCPSLADEKTTPLFNGKDLTGWKVEAKGKNIYWSVKNGVLHCQNGPNKRGSILWTQKEYGDFELTLEYKNGSGVIDSGVMLRGAHDQIQIGISGSLKRDMTGSPYIPRKGYPIEAKEACAAQKKNAWNTLKIRAIGNTYQTWINGIEGITYTSNTAVKKGPLGLQLHPKNEMQISFQNITITELNKDKTK